MDTGSIITAGQVPAAGDPGAPAAPLPHPPRIWRTAVALGTAIALVVALAIVLLASGTRPAAVFETGTPEYTFQAYLVAWDAHDLDGAYEQFSDRVKAELPVDQYRDMARSWGYDNGADRRIVLLESSVRDDRATLDLRIDERSSGGLFGGENVWSRTINVELVREGGAWHLDQAMAGLEPIWYEK